MKISLLLILSLLVHAPYAWSQTDYITIMNRIRSELLSQTGNTTTLDNNVTNTLATLQPNGSWPDVNYAYSATTYTADVHINRVKTFALAYTKSNSSYYQSAPLFTAIVNSLTYWNSADPQSWNWYHNQISNPQRIGEILILLDTSQSLGALRNALLTQMNRGNPGSQTGANKLDVATHFMYRACLTANDSLMQYSTNQVFYPLVFTTAEGIQHDLSYQQHGPQLYFFGYGSVFVDGETKIAYYLRGTSYALSDAPLSVFSNFVRNGFLKAMRGRYIDYGTNGRSISRENQLATSPTAQLEKLKALDTAHVTEYNENIARLNGSQPPGYLLPALHTQFWRSDYTLHHRTGYLFGVHMTSTRTAKQENGNGENLKGYYLSDGSTHIAANGNEYYNIPPVWDWSRIPGTTVPYITTFPLRAAWGANFGTTTFAGGVSDSLYGVSALQFSDYNTQARKAWFFFDNEVVCLGAGINSTAAQSINTTVNQCLLNGTVAANVNGTVSTIANGTYNYGNTLKWVTHNGISYYFPSGGSLQLSMKSQSGTWKSINNDGSTTVQNMNVFQLWFDHGIKPTNGTYAYYILPGQNMNTYDTTAVSIEQNTSAMQVVYHKGLNIRQCVFYEAGTFQKDSLTVTVDRPCTLMLRDVGTSAVKVSVADPAQSSLPVTILLNLPGIPQTRQLTASLPAGPYAGSSVTYYVTDQTPVYATSVVTAIADAYVRGGAAYANVNYGTAALVLKQDASISYTREVFLKFNVASLPAGTGQVKLRMYVSYANTSITSVPWMAQYVSNNSWTESGITYNNMPAVTSVVDTIMGCAAGSFAEWDVTNIALARQSADGILTLKLVSGLAGSTTDAIFTSREGSDTTRRPMLICSSGSTSRKMMATNENKTADISIYPNPAVASIYVNTTRHWDKAELCDIAGKILKVQQLNGQQQFKVSLSDMQPGTYILVLSSKGNSW